MANVDFDELVVHGYVKDFIKTNALNVIILVIYDYYLEWKWEVDSNKDNNLIVSKDGMKVTQTNDNYINQLTFSTIFLNHWIHRDGRYHIKFKLDGILTPCSNEIAIGIINQYYDIGATQGIGYDDNSWSWYIFSPVSSCTYKKQMGNTLNYGLNDQDECIFEVIIKNKSCIVNYYYQTLNGKKQTVIVQSINCKSTPISLEIVDQQNPSQLQAPGSVLSVTIKDIVIGFKFDCMDFEGNWYGAQVTTMDNNNKKIFIHFENWSNQYNEWIGFLNITHFIISIWRILILHARLFQGHPADQ